LCSEEPVVTVSFRSKKKERDHMSILYPGLPESTGQGTELPATYDVGRGTQEERDIISRFQASLREYLKAHVHKLSVPPVESFRPQVDAIVEAIRPQVDAIAEQLGVIEAATAALLEVAAEGRHRRTLLLMRFASSLSVLPGLDVNITRRVVGVLAGRLWPGINLEPFTNWGDLYMALKAHWSADESEYRLVMYVQACKTYFLDALSMPPPGEVSLCRMYLTPMANARIRDACPGWPVPDDVPAGEQARLQIQQDILDVDTNARLGLFWYGPLLPIPPA
jgi:hypothetical protein